MGRLTGEDNKRSVGSSKQLILKEVIHVNDKRTCRVDQLKGNDGELSLFSSKGRPHLSSKVDDLDVDHKSVQPRWPLSSQESGSWASSFRFELDSDDGKRLQAMLERDSSAVETNVGRKLTDLQSLTEPGTFESGSFRFIGNIGIEEFRTKYEPLKSSRQSSSFRFTTVFNANEKQGYDTVESGNSLNIGRSRIKAAVGDHVLASPRNEVLQRLRDLKAHPLSPSFTPEDAASYQKEKANVAAVRDDIHQRLNPLLKSESSRRKSSSSISQHHCKLPEGVLSEFEIMEIKERRRLSFSSPSELQGGSQRATKPAPMHLTTPTSRFRDDKHKLRGGCAIQEVIVEQSQVVVSNINSPSPDHVLSKPVAIPFKWEEEPGKAKTIAAAVDRAIARRLSQDGIDYMELQSGSQKGNVNSSVETGKGIGPDAPGRSSPNSSIIDQRSGSHRYYGREYLRGLSREASMRRSSRRYSTSEKEVLIDLDGSAAAKFLVEAFESPSKSHGSSPTFIVPFKWEDAPGKAKVDTIAQRPYSVLQLPPRLAVTSLGKSESFSSREHRVSSMFAGFFLPCLAASTPAHQKQSTSSKKLPPRVPSPPERRIRLGLIGRCSSTPKEGCQVRVSKSKTSSHTSAEKLFVKFPQTPARLARNMSTSELNSKSNRPSSPTSIFFSLDEGNSQTSGSSTMFSSGDLEDFSIQTHKSASKSSSSTSYENAEEDFAEFSHAATRTSAEDNGLLSKRRAPASRDYLNNEGEHLILETSPTVQSEETNSSPEVSLKRPSRLPYKMPAAAEQLLTSCSSSGRRQFLQDLSPRLLRQLSGKRLSGSPSVAKTPYRPLASASHAKAVSPSPAYAASSEYFPPAANQGRRGPATPKAFVPKSPPARLRRRVRLMSSIFKTLKRAVSRKKRRRKRSEAMLLHLEGEKSRAATFRFKTTYT